MAAMWINIVGFLATLATLAWSFEVERRRKADRKSSQDEVIRAVKRHVADGSRRTQRTVRFYAMIVLLVLFGSSSATLYETNLTITTFVASTQVLEARLDSIQVNIRQITPVSPPDAPEIGSEPNPPPGSSDTGADTLGTGDPPGHHSDTSKVPG